MSPEDDHRDLLQLMGRRLAHEPWRERSMALRARVNCAWGHLSSMLEEADSVLMGWDGLDQVRYRYRQILRQVADIGLLAAGGHAEHVERGTVNSKLERPREPIDAEGLHDRSLPLLALRRTRWLPSDLAAPTGRN